MTTEEEENTMISRTRRKEYESEIERVETIDELVWIGTDFKQDTDLSARDLYILCMKMEEKRDSFLKAGQKYSRARKPAWR